MELLNLRPQETDWPSGIPLLIVHGDRDRCTPYEDALKFRRSNPETIKLHTLHGADHGFGDKIREAYRVSCDWFAEHRRGKTVP